MQKRLSFFLLLLCMSYIAHAELRVFSVSGNVSRWTGTNWEELYKGIALLPTDRIRMTEYAQLSIADEKHKLLLPVQAEGEYTVEQLITTAKQHKTGFLKGCWNTVVAILQGTPANVATGAPGTTYRNDDTDREVALALRQRLSDNNWGNLSLQTDYRIELQLIDMYQGIFRTQLSVGELVRPLVTNHSNTPLFVAIVDWDGKGNAVSVLPSDKEQMLTSLLVPPLSTVMLPFPLEFTETGTDYLYLIASPDLFNMKHILELLTDTPTISTPSTKIGVSKTIISII